MTHDPNGKSDPHGKKVGESVQINLDAADPDNESLRYLTGALGADRSTPSDLAVEHDRYQARADTSRRRRSANDDHTSRHDDSRAT
jgi:hypothetical protein